MSHLPQSGDVCACAQNSQSDLRSSWKRAACRHKAPEQGQVLGVSDKLLLGLNVSEPNRSQEWMTGSHANKIRLR
jgi:hypothetical protein